MKKILIIEDDVNVVTLLTQILENQNFTVISASDSLQGTTIAHQENPDLIILDLILPLGGGETSLRNLKMSTHTKEIPIIVMSATVDEHLIERVKNMGIEAFIEKPFDTNNLISKVQATLGKEQ